MPSRRAHGPEESGAECRRGFRSDMLRSVDAEHVRPSPLRLAALLCCQAGTAPAHSTRDHIHLCLFLCASHEIRCLPADRLCGRPPHTGRSTVQVRPRTREPPRTRAASGTVPSLLCSTHALGRLHEAVRSSNKICYQPAALQLCRSLYSEAP